MITLSPEEHHRLLMQARFGTEAGRVFHDLMNAFTSVYLYSSALIDQPFDDDDAAYHIRKLCQSTNEFHQKACIIREQLQYLSKDDTNL